MNTQFADLFIATNKQLLPRDAASLTLLRNQLTNLSPEQEMLVNSTGLKDPTVALILSLMFGYLGVDRFYNGQILLGLLKLLTAGFCLIWMFIDFFLIMDAVRKRNFDKLVDIPTFNKIPKSDF